LKIPAGALPLHPTTFEKVDKTFVRICDSKFSFKITLIFQNRTK